MQTDTTYVRGVGKIVYIKPTKKYAVLMMDDQREIYAEDFRFAKDENGERPQMAEGNLFSFDIVPVHIPGRRYRAVNLKLEGR